MKLAISSFLFPFSSKFPDLNFASYVRYILIFNLPMLCYVTHTHSEPGLPVITLALAVHSKRQVKISFK